MKRWTLFALGAVAYTAALVALAPATLVDAVLARASADRVRLVEAGGTVWSGSGLIEIRDAKQRSGVARRVAWHVAPGALLRGELALEATTSDSAKPVSITATLTRVEVENAELSVPAAILGLAAPKLAPLELTGNLTLQVARLTFAHGKVHGNAAAQWHAAGSALSKVSPLGAYALRIDPADTGMRATLSTLQGPLELKGAGSWTNGAGVFQGRAEVAPPHREALAPLLRLVAVERAEGQFDFELR